MGRAEIIQHCKTTVGGPFQFFKVTLENRKTLERLTHLSGGWQFHVGHYLHFCQFEINIENVKLAFN